MKHTPRDSNTTFVKRKQENAGGKLDKRLMGANASNSDVIG
jgi:hypothetical protein